ncbi:MAG: type II toxin-antitoxin system HicB family antitoxin [Lachnospiraceae bacterium]|nr:type II toxin-antitoxin system HicB family antitoxin [Lachnospiraceae bacterium]
MNFDDYCIEVWYSQIDEAFLAQIREIQGCVADGKTREDAIKELRIVFDLITDVMQEKGTPIPAPRKREIA